MSSTPLLVSCMSRAVLLAACALSCQVLSKAGETTAVNADARPNAADSCRYTIVETIPEGLAFAKGSPKHMSTYDAWRQLISLSTSNIKIASFYWTLSANLSVYPSAQMGEQIYQDLLYAGRNRSIDIKITQNAPSDRFPSLDSKNLAEEQAAEVRSLNLTRLGKTGVLHTKFWVVDGMHAYIGSANMDWRALAQVKEVGVLITNCTFMATDLEKIFEVYWLMSDDNAKLPDAWPANLSTSVNSSNPASIDLNGTRSLTYISSAPPYFSTSGRTEDFDAIVDIINSAKKFVYVAVMNFLPIDYYSKNKTFWPLLDNALRRVAIENGVHVRLLVSRWSHSKPVMWSMVESLAAINSSKIFIEVKAMQIPKETDEQRRIPYARVNHAKMMVTDKAAYVGTSNWEPSYFTSTTGVGLVINQDSDDSFRGELKAIFERDWNSNFSYYIRPFNKRKRF
ncbi:hypothetical protein V5799_005969 [Amblyomma americanum]|uniref:PLD phosphodiesterase domain-containing protein n=1 Tax=Amblyomma americanum TaxID=6943 RepID=A0AAQ4DXQ9_AMBAM